MDGEATVGEIVDTLSKAPPEGPAVTDPSARVLREVRAAVQRYGR